MTRIEVPMPQMGESIAEGTVSKWLKQVGDPVERDEPILEISTDKVDAEIPSPESGILSLLLYWSGIHCGGSMKLSLKSMLAGSIDSPRFNLSVA